MAAQRYSLTRSAEGPPDLRPGPHSEVHLREGMHSQSAAALGKSGAEIIPELPAGHVGNKEEGKLGENVARGGIYRGGISVTWLN